MDQVSWEGLRQKSGGSGCARAGLSNGMDFTKVISDGRWAEIALKP